MAFYAKDEYIGDGSNDVFNITFPYLNRDLIKVYINDVEDPAITFLTDTQIKTSVVPEDGAIVQLARNTPLDRRVDFKNASLLDSQILDEDSMQMMHIVQEAYDGLENTMGRGTANDWNAEGLPISHVGDPVDPDDAMNMRSAMSYLEATEDARDQAVVARSEAESAEAGAETAETNAGTSEANALIYKNDAETARTGAESAEAGAVSAKDSAVIAKTGAETAETNAGTSEANALIYKNDTETARTGAETAEAGAVSAKDSAVIAKTGAETAETNAESAEAGAETAEANASTSEANALASENKAEKWAEENEDVEVETGKYSAKHHATKSIQGAIDSQASADASALSATDANNSATTAQTAESGAVTAKNQAETARDNAQTAESGAVTAKNQAETARDNAQTAEANASTSEANASTSEANALASENKAEKWAEENEDVEVEPSQYSAFHWAKKAQAEAGSVEGMQVHDNTWHSEDFETTTGAQSKANTAETNANSYTDGAVRTDEEIQDVIGALVQAGANVSIDYDDVANTLTISSSFTNTQRSDEEIQDVVGTFIQGGSNVTASYDDVSNTLTISATDTNTQRSDEEIQDVVGALVQGGSNVTASYDDVSNTLTISATDTNTQRSDSEIQTAINGDGDHGSTAQHDYFTSGDAVSAIGGSKNDGGTGTSALWSASKISSVIPNGGQWASGRYIGNGGTNRTINVGFVPDIVIIAQNDLGQPYGEGIETFIFSNNHPVQNRYNSNIGARVYSSGFLVGDYSSTFSGNTDDSAYQWIAIKV